MENKFNHKQYLKSYFNFTGEPQLLAYPDTLGNVFFTGYTQMDYPIFLLQELIWECLRCIFLHL
jgi:hypothetical protein